MIGLIKVSLFKLINMKISGFLLLFWRTSFSNDWFCQSQFLSLAFLVTPNLCICHWLLQGCNHKMIPFSVLNYYTRTRTKLTKSLETKLQLGLLSCLFSLLCLPFFLGKGWYSDMIFPCYSRKESELFSYGQNKRFRSTDHCLTNYLE